MAVNKKYIYLVIQRKKEHSVNDNNKEEQLKNKDYMDVTVLYAGVDKKGARDFAEDYANDFDCEAVRRDRFGAAIKKEDVTLWRYEYENHGTYNYVMEIELLKVKADEPEGRLLGFMKVMRAK